MKYFTYQEFLDPSLGYYVSPAKYINGESLLGLYVSGSYYGKAETDSLDGLENFNVQEISKYDYPFSPEEKFVEKIKDGYDTGFGYFLALGESDRNAFTQLLVLLREANAPDAMEVDVADTNGVLHKVSVAQLRPMLINYGLYYQGIWADYRVSSG
jgi:hypothetical protein